MRFARNWGRLGMKFEMKTKALRFLSDIQTGPFGSQLHKEDYVDDGTPIVTVEHLGNRVFTEQNLPRVSNEDKQRLSKYILKEGDIVFSRVGSVDRCSFVDSQHTGWLFSGRCLRVRPFEEISPLFLYYFFCLESTKKFMRNIAVGATMPSINTKLMGEIEVSYPDKQVQEKIANLLGAIDDKIELNNAINDNLEQQAQAIYTQYFIKNKAPNWKLGQLSDLILVKYGKDHKKLADGIYPVYGSGGIMRYVERPLYTGESVLIPRKGTLNNVTYVNGSFWSVDTMFYTEMLHPNVAKYVHLFLKSRDLASLNAGSAVPSMTTNILNAMQIYIPDKKVLAYFEEAVSPLYLTIQKNEEQSSTLVELRDALLPKLMSGELDVSAIEL